MVYNNWIKINFFVLGLVPFFLSSQKVPYKTIYWKLDGHFGFIVEHRSNLGHLVQGHIYGSELSMNIPSTGKFKWEYENNFPEKGVSLYWFNLGNPEQLGQLFALSPHFEIPLKARPAKARLHFRLGTGLAYATKYFDPVTNHKNNVISAPLNGFVAFKFLMKKDLSDRNRLDLGISFVHASNGKIKVPNLGINMATVNLAYVFKGAPKPGNERIFPTYVDSSHARRSRHEFIGIASYGLTAIYPVGHSKYFAQSYILGYYLNVGNTHKWGVGTDIFFNPANVVLSWREDSLKVTPVQNLQVGLRIGWAYNIGQFSIPVEFGYYIKTTYREEGFIYNRIGVRYYMKNNIILALGLKAHLARADYFEYGIGYRFPVMKKQAKL